MFQDHSQGRACGTDGEDDHHDLEGLEKYRESHGIESLALMEKQPLCTKNLESSSLSKKAPLCSNNFNFLLKMNSMSAEPAAFPLNDGKRLWRWTLYAAFLFQGEGFGEGEWPDRILPMTEQ